MRYLVGWILVITVLFAQSAWTFEGHPGHFEAGAHTERSAKGDAFGEHSAPPSDFHCPHSPVHFMGLPVFPQVSVVPTAAEPPPYQGQFPSFSLDPPTQPPRA